MQQQGMIPNYEASLSKMFGSELQKAMSAFMVGAVGLWGGVRRGGHPDVSLLGAIPEAYMGSSILTVSQGTSEIQRNIIAFRGVSCWGPKTVNRERGWR